VQGWILPRLAVDFRSQVPNVGGNRGDAYGEVLMVGHRSE